jgi:hypothetical protein
MPASPFVASCFVVFRFVVFRFAVFRFVGVLRAASPETAICARQSEPVMSGRGPNAWNHGAAVREIVWILVDNRGQLGVCEYRRHPYR